jgi:lipoprotein-releasing system ATP-binding protein
MITARNITKAYGELKVLKGINLHVAQSEIISIVGASGAGKTTLLQILGTLDHYDGGELSINGIATATLKGKQLAAFRNKHIGFIFQFHHLLPEFSAIENVCMPAWIANVDKQVAYEKGMKLLSFLNLSDRARHKPSELSGGEQQRVAVARALINTPAVVFADEPSGNLDSKNAAELHDLFFKLRDEFKHTFVIVTHNESLANRADRKLVIKDGIIDLS